MDEKKLRTNPVKVIRAYCLDCCLASPHEVALCPAAHCPLWPFRFGKNPYRKERSVAQMEASKRLGQRAVLARNANKTA